MKPSRFSLALLAFSVLAACQPPRQPLDYCGLPGHLCVPRPESCQACAPIVWCCPPGTSSDNPCVPAAAASDCDFLDTVVICDWGIENQDGTVECFD